MDFQPFPLIEDDKTKQIVADVQAICYKVAQDNRGDDVDSAYVVQHSADELHALYEIASGIHDSFPVEGHILQCGIFCGGSAFTMAHAIRDSATINTQLIAIDSYTKDYRPLRQLFDDAHHEFRENLWEFRLHEHIVAVLSDTVSFLRSFWRYPVRLAFIDSSHHYEPTRQEIEHIFPHLQKGSWLIFHDYFSEEVTGVSRAVNELFENQPLNDYEFFRVHELAIIRKKVIIV